MSQQQIIAGLKQAREVLDMFLSNPLAIQAISDAAQLLIGAAQNDQRIYSCGNGGSMSDAMHFAEVGLQVDLVQAHLAFLDVAGFEADDRLLVGAEHPLGGQRERLLGQADHGGGGIRVAAQGQQQIR